MTLSPLKNPIYIQQSLGVLLNLWQKSQTKPLSMLCTVHMEKHEI